MLPVSAYIICFNEERVIGDCIASLDFCSEIVIVDSGSTDRTLEIIADYEKRGFPIVLSHNDWPGFAKQKQLAFEKCSQDWRLNMDADERVDDNLKAAIGKALGNVSDKISAFAFPRRDLLPGYGYAHKLVGHKYVTKLARKDRARYILDRAVHEEFRVDGKVQEISSGFLLHDREMTVAQEAEKNVGYARLKAAERLQKGRKPSALRLFVSPPLTFLKYWLLKRYILCGQAGFIYAGMFGLYSFVTEAEHFRAYRRQGSASTPHDNDVG